ncbi:GntR family transcriptional regulator [Candidatus Epulonipiscium fishelsonii]|uniref:GntR family transcriptional regulator n=1 Tax=Candidatus Epulonipiscium fishelsonii TaxID=77094 RepID=A0ACC8XCZ6_9FIRM|nr:GntR family transcriptional regulator [Epulopiscium sp. SCG-D08WGA-EpuloA1]OON97697.1 MAG: GntR family transcriptional regulator [Epulopiscium sp. AS2M-Bin002]
MDINDYQPLRNVVFQTIRKAILEGELQPGERLMETQLAEKLGVSRTPIREAIRKLETEGLIIITPRKGAQVAPFTQKEIADVLEVRGTLEALAVRLACKRITPKNFLKLDLVITEYEYAVQHKDVNLMIQKDIEFHDIIFAATQNEKLIQMFNNIREQVLRYRITYLKNVTDGAQVLLEHRDIFKSLELKNEEIAAQLITRHIENQRDSILYYIREQEKKIKLNSKIG